MRRKKERRPELYGRQREGNIRAKDRESQGQQRPWSPSPVRERWDRKRSHQPQTSVSTADAPRVLVFARIAWLLYK